VIANNNNNNKHQQQGRDAATNTLEASTHATLVGKAASATDAVGTAVDGVNVEDVEGEGEEGRGGALDLQSVAEAMGCGAARYFELAHQVGAEQSGWQMLLSHVAVFSVVLSSFVLVASPVHFVRLWGMFGVVRV